MSELIEAYETSGTYIRRLNKKDMLFLSQDSFTSSSDPDSCTIMGYKSEYLGQGGLFISVNRTRTERTPPISPPHDFHRKEL